MASWLKNAWYVAGYAHEVQSGVLGRRILDHSIVFFRDEAGQIVAMQDRCPHRLVPLSLGVRTEQGTIACGYHGMEFDNSGTCVWAPGQAAPKSVKVQTFPAVVRHNLIWVWVGDPELADPALIPDIYWYDDPAWTMAPGYHHFNANFRLIVDNLLDLSHEAYVHQHTIGHDAIPDSDPEVTVSDDGAIWALREMKNIDPPPFFRLFMNYAGRIDRTQKAFFAPPSICMTEYTGKRVEGDQTVLLNRAMHILTPETETSTHYFWGQARNYRINEVALSEQIAEATARTFDEDRAILESQQKIITEEGASVPEAAIRFDIAPVRGQRILSALIDQERADPKFALRPARIAQ